MQSCNSALRSIFTIEQLRGAFQLDPINGRLMRNGKPVGSVSRYGYVCVRFAGRTLFAHRVVWALVHGCWPSDDIDHINGDRSDNRPANLRDVSRAVNCQNKAAALSTNKTSGLLGVNHHASNGRRFRAQIWVDGKNRHIGYFDTVEQAHAAYLEAKEALHPGFVAKRFA